MRAIDADAFKDYIRGACEDMKHLFNDNGAVAKLITESFCKDIDEQPTIQPDNNSEMPNSSDLISRQAAIDAFNTNIDELVVSGKENADAVERYLNRVIGEIKQLPLIQSEIVRCRKCKFASGDSRICMKFGHSPIGELDFCAWAERRTNEE